jgi:hypothetical protein
VPAPVATGGQDFVVGDSVAAGGSSKSVWFGGGRLAKDLTLPTLRAGWRSIDDQGAAWRADADGGGREKVVIDPEAWEEGARRARAVTDRLGEIPTEDRAGWASAARDGAGVFAALSHHFEGERRGALAAAADMLARSAQKADHRQPRRTDMAGLATVAAQAALVHRGARGRDRRLALGRRQAPASRPGGRARPPRPWRAGQSRELHRRAEAVVGHDGHQVDKKLGERGRWPMFSFIATRSEWATSAPKWWTYGANVR